MPSRTRPVLISSLGRRIVAIGRLSYAGALGYATAFDPGYRRHNSAQRLHSLRRALTVPDDLAAAVKANAGAGLVSQEIPVKASPDRKRQRWAAPGSKESQA
jgi:ATP-dependent DNA helicase RecQ